jgi:hypothetical protein
VHSHWELHDIFYQNVSMMMNCLYYLMVCDVPLSLSMIYFYDDVERERECMVCTKSKVRRGCIFLQERAYVKPVPQRFLL